MAEEAAFRRQRARFLRQYPGEFVAVRGGKDAREPGLDLEGFCGATEACKDRSHHQRFLGAEQQAARRR